jgi:hypothetical protein
MKKTKLRHTLVLIYTMVVLTVIAPGSFLGALFVSPIKGFVEAAYINPVLPTSGC